MRIVGITQKIVIEQSSEINNRIHKFLSEIENVVEVEILDLGTKIKQKYAKPTEYMGDNFAYYYRYEEKLDRLMLRPNFGDKSIIWIDLTDDNLKDREFIQAGIFKMISPLSIEYGQILNNRNTRTSTYTFLDKELGDKSTEKTLGFNIDWLLGVDFKVDIKSKIPKEILLKAPAYKVEELDNGCIFVQLTKEEPDPIEFDEEYVAAFLEFYNYCKDYVDSNSK